MRNLAIFCLVSLIITTTAWRDYTDYYEEEYESDVPRLEVRLGSKLTLTCNGDPEDSTWIHNGEDYPPFHINPPITKWLENSSIEIKVNHEEDAGVWKCFTFDSLERTYRVIIDYSYDNLVDSYTSEYGDSTSSISDSTISSTSPFTESSTLKSVSSSTTFQTTEHDHDTTIKSSTRVYLVPPSRKSAVTVKSTNKNGEDLAAIIGYEIKMGVDNPFFNFKSASMNKSSAAGISVSSVILLITAMNMIICLFFE